MKNLIIISLPCIIYDVSEYHFILDQTPQKVVQFLMHISNVESSCIVLIFDPLWLFYFLKEILLFLTCSFDELKTILGLWKAIQEKILGLEDFALKEVNDWAHYCLFFWGWTFIAKFLEAPQQLCYPNVLSWLGASSL